MIVRDALRSFRRTPLFTAVAILSLGLARLSTVPCRCGARTLKDQDESLVGGRAAGSKRDQRELFRYARRVGSRRIRTCLAGQPGRSHKRAPI